ncbi:MAG: FumA C-terminus/TtdB family hydratase beta subunit [Candidatus Omnitrophica bacterium]|nr:FumA C-terminus/TtdB family hydratase beta subunit [Candidatus Omnitrophota bacterium]MBU4472746.1 FumA C-terminus/TtdB family hydratase beta subunit [Candidatus Omnitrophota bacterium]
MKIKTPLEKKEIRKLKMGERVLLSGIIYAARDQAHQRLIQEKKLPIDLKGAIIYYCGPTPAPKGKIIGSCGPTTSSRMDQFTPALLKQGVLAMIGKGRRSKEVIQAIKKYKAVYFLTYAGCGALLKKYIKEARLICYQDLGPEAIYKLEVKDFPLIVGIDAKGRSIYRDTLSAKARGVPLI